MRVLAHMTDCKGMIEAFRLGGDFHSRTALVIFIIILMILNIGNVLRDQRWTRKRQYSFGMGQFTRCSSKTSAQG